MKNIKKMTELISWAEFRDSGALWFVNRLLHVFGLVICLTLNDDGDIVDAYPAKCCFRGFDTKSEDEGYRKITHYMHENASSFIEDLDA